VPPVVDKKDAAGIALGLKEAIRLLADPTFMRSELSPAKQRSRTIEIPEEKERAY
jgi:hypothetical protein